MQVGVLALQGAVREHLNMLSQVGAKPVSVKWPNELEGLDGLIVPGGESTTIGKLIKRFGFEQAIRDVYANGTAIYGTCAGLILLARRITEGTQPLLGLMDIEARRNAYGRQIDSFETDLSIEDFDKSFRAVFIRAPWIERTLSKDVEVLAEHDGHAVAARQGQLLVTAFHPELTEDVRLHKYFLQMIEESRVAEKELGARS